MASACVNNIPTTPATSYTGYGWLSPRVSLSHDYKDEEPSSPEPGDFEFRLGGNNNSTTMLSADQLFSDGKLVPLHFSSSAKTAPPPPSTPPEKSSCKSISEDPYLLSPKAPRCSSRWRDLFGLKKLNQTKTVSSGPSTSSTSSSTSTNTSTSSKSMLLFLNRNSKTASSSSVDSSLSLPLLKDSGSSSSDFESVSMSSSRLSLSSSSSGHDHDELPRASLDAEKPITHRSGPKVRTRPRMENPRVGRSSIRKESKTRGVSVDSPRMNPSGKVVFQSLERSSSSPSSFNGGLRYNKHHNRGVMERSYSGNVHVRITPVLNVPVCSLRGSSKSGVFGFGNLFSPSSSQKKEGSNNGSTKTHHHHHHHGKKKEKKEKEKEKESC